MTSQITSFSRNIFDEYKEIWGSFDSELFKFKSEIFYKKRNEFCYAVISTVKEAPALSINSILEKYLSNQPNLINSK